MSPSRPAWPSAPSPRPDRWCSIPAPTSPTLFAFLPVHHIVAVEASRVWPWLEDYVAAYAGQAQPRNVNLITGASGTTDIEGTLVHGAHGPGFLHVVLISR